MDTEESVAVVTILLVGVINLLFCMVRSEIDDIAYYAIPSHR